jgi:ribonuclease D
VQPRERVFDPEAYRALNGARKLGVAGRRALRALFTWREDVAEQRDVPPFRVVPNDVLLSVSARIDREGALDAQVIAKIKRAPTDEQATLAMAEVIRRGLEIEEPSLDERMRNAGEKKGDRERFKARMERMRQVRSAHSTRLGINPGFLVSAAILERLAHDPPTSIDDLRTVRGFTAWRVDVVGEELLAALRSQ